jgi:periplasmic protein TonB
VAGAGRRGSTKRGGRSPLFYALLASVLFHLALLVFMRALPPPAARPQKPLVFTIVERPVRPKTTPQRPPPPAAAPRTPGARTHAQQEAGPPTATTPPEVAVAPGAKDSPFVVGPPGAPSLREMSARSAEEVVKERGPQHTPGTSIGERLKEKLAIGVGEVAVQRSGFWDTYFTVLRKAVLAAWSEGKPDAHFPKKASVRIRLVMNAEGLLLDFDIIQASGSKAMDHEVELALHQTPHFPPPPDNVMQSKTELVTEWVLTVHPGLAQAQGTPVFGPSGPTMLFDMVTIVNPAVDLTPLELNVALASYWTR